MEIRIRKPCDKIIAFMIITIILSQLPPALQSPKPYLSDPSPALQSKTLSFHHLSPWSFFKPCKAICQEKMPVRVSFQSWSRAPVAPIMSHALGLHTRQFAPRRRLLFLIPGYFIQTGVYTVGSVIRMLKQVPPPGSDSILSFAPIKSARSYIPSSPK